MTAEILGPDGKPWQQEERATFRDPDEWLIEWAQGRRTVSGERVNEQLAMGVSAWFGCIRNISEDVAKLPLILYRRLAEGGKKRADNNSLYGVLHDEPNDEMSAMTFWETLLQHAVGWGGGYAEIVRDGQGRVSQLYPLDPSTVKQDRNRTGELFYEVRLDGQDPVRLTQRSMFHIHGLGPMGNTGYNITILAREALGAVIAAQKFGASFFGGGAALGAVLQHPKKLSPEALENLRKSWLSRHGTAKNANQVGILEEGMTYQQLGIAPENAQFIETKQFDVETVCRYHRMPPHKVQHLLRSTFSNIEHQAIEYVGDTLLPWMVRITQEIGRKLIRIRGLFAEHLIDALLRADTKSRFEAYKLAIEAGWMNGNEVRIRENMNPVAGLDDYRIPLNMGIVGKELAPNGGDEGSESDSVDDGPDADGGERLLHERLAEAHRTLLAERFRSVLKTERDKIGRALKRGNWESWSARFFVDHAAYVRGALIPAVDTYCESVWAVVRAGEVMPDDALSAVASHTAGIATRHVEGLRATMSAADVAAIDAYDADVIADREMVELVNLMVRLTEN